MSQGVRFSLLDSSLFSIFIVQAWAYRTGDTPGSKSFKFFTVLVFAQGTARFYSTYFCECTVKDVLLKYSSSGSSTVRS